MDLQRPLSPNTSEQYTRILARALGPTRDPQNPQFVVDVAAWPEGTKKLLRAALRRWALEAGRPPEPLVARVPKRYEVRRARRFPTEEEALRYEAAARELPPGVRALALLPLAMGLRASSLLALTRLDVERAASGADDGKLRVYLKGGEERFLPARHVLNLLNETLELPAAPGPQRIGQERTRAPRRWGTLGEALSGGKRISQYHALHELIRATGRKAGIEGLRPHLLRHVFASRLHRDGAPVAAIQWLMGHKDMTTTMIYLHEDGSNVTKWLRPF